MFLYLQFLQYFITNYRSYKHMGSLTNSSSKFLDDNSHIRVSRTSTMENDRLLCVANLGHYKTALYFKQSPQSNNWFTLIYSEEESAIFFHSGHLKGSIQPVIPYISRNRKCKKTKKTDELSAVNKSHKVCSKSSNSPANPPKHLRRYKSRMLTCNKSEKSVITSNIRVHSIQSWQSQ